MILDKIIKNWINEKVEIDQKMIDVYENPQKYAENRKIKSFNDVHEKQVMSKNFKGKFIKDQETSLFYL